jgi:UDPglucose--hexose-1-phosphate uridylyltransferase
MPVVFRSEEVKSTILDPRRNFEPVTHEMEFRFDPLTGRSSRLAHFGAIRPVPLTLENYDGDNKGFCPFCPPNLEKITSRFPAELVPEGIIRRGEAAVIANIAPYDAYSGLVIVSDKHVLSVDDLTESRLTDALSAGLDFLCRVKSYDPEIPYTFMGWNYMPPSGGGLVHAHIQVFGSKNPGNLYLDSLQGSQRYLLTHGRSFWQDYLSEEERLGERFLTTHDGVSWVVPFAPLGIIGDVLAIVPGATTPESVTPATVDALVSGIRRLFNYYSASQIYSFNASFFFASDSEADFPLQVRFTARTFLNTRFFPPDTNFFQMQLQQPMCVIRPEDICRDIRPYFNSNIT